MPTLTLPASAIAGSATVQVRGCAIGLLIDSYEALDDAESIAQLERWLADDPATSSAQQLADTLCSATGREFSARVVRKHRLRQCGCFRKVSK